MSMANLKAVYEMSKSHGIRVIFDATGVWRMHFIKKREPAMRTYDARLCMRCSPF